MKFELRWAWVPNGKANWAVSAPLIKVLQFRDGEGIWQAVPTVYPDKEEEENGS